MKNFYPIGNNFSRDFKGTATAEELMEVWEMRTGFHTGNNLHYMYYIYIYRISRNICGDLNLAIWQSWTKPSN